MNNYKDTIKQWQEEEEEEEEEDQSTYIAQFSRVHISCIPVNDLPLQQLNSKWANVKLTWCSTALDH